MSLADSLLSSFSSFLFDAAAGFFKAGGIAFAGIGVLGFGFGFASTFTHPTSASTYLSTIDSTILPNVMALEPKANNDACHEHWRRAILDVPLATSNPENQETLSN